MFSTINFYEAPPKVGVGHELRIINVVEMSTRFHDLWMIGTFEMPAFALAMAQGKEQKGQPSTPETNGIW